MNFRAIGLIRFAGMMFPGTASAGAARKCKPGCRTRRTGSADRNGNQFVLKPEKSPPRIAGVGTVLVNSAPSRLR